MVRAGAALAPLALLAAAPGPAAPAAEPLADAAWLAGRWVGTGLGGQVEEAWAPPAGVQMVGHFRLIRDGRPVFYELMLIDRSPEGLRLRVKHFNPDFTGWEARDGWTAFPSQAAAPDDLRFDGLGYRRDGDELVATVMVRKKAGVTEPVVFRLRRASI